MKYLAILGGHDSEALLAGDDSVKSIEQQVRACVRAACVEGNVKYRRGKENKRTERRQNI